LRIVKGGKGTAGTKVAPAGEFKPRTSAKVRLEFAMNIYTKPAAPATKTATDSTAPQGPSWRDILQIHPAAALFPRLSRDELRALGEDILENGQRVPIALWKERTELPPSLLDGIGRLDAMEAVGLHVEVNFFRSPQGPTHVSLYCWHPRGRIQIASTDIVGDDPYAYVISANIRRRHLSIEDKDSLIVQLLKADPTKSNRIVAKLTDTSHPHVAKVRERAEKVGDVETVTTSIDTKGRAQPATKLPRGKFTPEKIKQIKNLAERGASREDIATTIGVTTGSLQIACSRLGISLRPKATTTPTPPPPEDTRDDIGPASSGEIARLNARTDELQIEKRRLEIENIGFRSEVEETKAARKPEGEDEDSELGNLLRAWDYLLRAWDRASQGAREKFKARVGLPAKAMEDGLDIPECLPGAAP
jgi:hypothetical protein